MKYVIFYLLYDISMVVNGLEEHKYYWHVCLALLLVGITGDILNNIFNPKH